MFLLVFEVEILSHLFILCFHLKSIGVLRILTLTLKIAYICTQEFIKLELYVVAGFTLKFYPLNS